MSQNLAELAETAITATEGSQYRTEAPAKRMGNVTLRQALCWQWCITQRQPDD
jgi:hypothetical protein